MPISIVNEDVGNIAKYATKLAAYLAIPLMLGAWLKMKSIRHCI